MIPVELLAAALGSDTPVSTRAGRAFLRLHQIGRLRVESGEIAVADMDPLDATGFTRLVPAGHHPVLVGVVEGDERCRNAFVLLRFSDELPAYWEPARREGETDTEAGLVGVDSGCVCLAEPEVLGAMLQERLRPPEVREFAPGCRAAVIADGEDAEGDEDDRDEVDFADDFDDDDEVDEEPLARNLAVVETAEGDGIYPCYFGLGDSDEVVALAVDFDFVLEQAGADAA